MGIKQIGYVALAIVLLCLVAWTANSFPRKSVVDDVLKAREAEIRQEYETKIAANNIKIKEQDVIIETSQVKLDGLNKEIKRLKAKSAAVKPPVSDKETRDALIELGYPPTN